MSNIYDVAWYDAPLKTCPICGKQFAPAVEHYWKIGSAYSFDSMINSRNIPVCSYTCMRKWEKEQENAANKTCTYTYSKEVLTRLPEVLPDMLELRIAELYFRDGRTIKEIALDLMMSGRTVSRKIKKIKTILDDLEEAEK